MPSTSSNKTAARAGISIIILAIVVAAVKYVLIDPVNQAYLAQERFREQLTVSRQVPISKINPDLLDDLANKACDTEAQSENYSRGSFHGKIKVNKDGSFTAHCIGSEGNWLLNNGSADDRFVSLKDSPIENVTFTVQY